MYVFSFQNECFKLGSFKHHPISDSRSSLIPHPSLSERHISIFFLRCSFFYRWTFSHLIFVFLNFTIYSLIPRGVLLPHSIQVQLKLLTFFFSLHFAKTFQSVIQRTGAGLRQRQCLHWKYYISISFHIEWDMIVVTVFLSILNQREFHLVQNRRENCHHDEIPFILKGNGKICTYITHT